MEMHIQNPTTQEAEAGGLTGLHGETLSQKDKTFLKDCQSTEVFQITFWLPLGFFP